MPIGPDEEIVRAICTDKWDGQRVSPSLFKGANTSVSRLSVIPLNSHWDLFRIYVQKPPERLLRANWPDQRRYAPTARCRTRPVDAAER